MTLITTKNILEKLKLIPSPKWILLGLKEQANALKKEPKKKAKTLNRKSQNAKGDRVGRFRQPEVSRDDCGTPQDYFDEVSERWGPFYLDAAAAEENTKCVNYFTKSYGALLGPWEHHTRGLPGYGTSMVWCNPPYSKPAGPLIKWVAHAIKQVMDGHCKRVVMLLPNDSSTDWHKKYVWDEGNQCKYPWVRHIGHPKRLKFVGAKGTSPFPNLLLVLEKPK